MQNVECRMQNDGKASKTQILRSWFFVLRYSFLVLTFCILHSAFLISARAAPAEITLDQLANGVKRFVLENGLVVLTRDDPGAPVVSIQIWVGAGSIHEQEFMGGGLSHLIEHMIFKGTQKHGPGEISRAINDLGGEINAYTSLDRTVFLVDIPAAHWSKGLAVLADAVLNASFPEDEWRREKDVILREMAMGKDNPDRQATELLFQTAYRIHPYRTPAIGYEDIFKTLTRADLLAFFSRHYLPNNMILSIVGDVREVEVRAEVRKQFANYPRRAYAPVVPPAEPDQIGLRTACQTGAWNVARLEWAWHTVALSHPDAPALDLLAAIIGQGRSSRLSQTIQENQKLASRIEAWSFTPREPGLFGISAVFDPTNALALDRALEAEIKSWATVSFRPAEIEKARLTALTGALSAFQTMHGQADQLAAGEFYAGTPAFFQVYLRRLHDVTPATLTAVVRRYLKPENLTKVVLLPADAGRLTPDDGTEKQTSNIQRATGEQALVPRAADRTSKIESLKPTGRDLQPEIGSRKSEIQKTLQASGMALLTQADHKLPFVNFLVACRGGVLFENESNSGISTLMAELMIHGTVRRSSAQIAALVESRGGNLAAFAGQNSFGLMARCLKGDVNTFMDLLADCLLNPAFTPNEVAKQKTLQLATIKQQRESPMFMAQEALRQALFPNHPYRFSPEGTSAAVEALSRQALRDYHAKMVVGDNTVLAIFGDITADTARSLAQRFFGRFPTGIRPALEHRPNQPILPQRLTRVMPKKEQTILLAGFPGIDVKDPRRDALDVLQKAMNGLSSDLMTRIRDKQGLAYYTGVLQRPGLDPGFFALYAGTHTGAVEQVLGLMRTEIQRITAQGLRGAEFARARSQLIAAHQQSLQLPDETALTCALDELYGLGYAHSLSLEQRLQALTPEDVRKAAAALLVTNQCVTVVVRPSLNAK